MNGLNKKLIWTVVFGLITIVAITFFADAKNTVNALKEFKIFYLPLILGLTFVNYLLRFVKWHYFLKQIEVDISLKDSFAVFLSGLAMSVTPGKVGELLKSLLLKEIKNVPVSKTAPVVFAERLSDGFGLILLSLTGMMMFSHGKEVLAFVAIAMLAILFVIKNPKMYNYFIDLCGKVPFVKRFVSYIEIMFESAGKLMCLRALLFTVLLSVISWSFECIAFYYVFIGLNHKVSLVIAVFTLAFSSVVGAASMLPGGLGAAEGSIMGLLVKVAGVPKNIAAVATIIIRFCTLWFGVFLGLLALASKRQLLGNISSNDKMKKEGVVE